MIDENRIIELLKKNKLSRLADVAYDSFGNAKHHGDYQKFKNYFDSLPNYSTDSINLNSSQIIIGSEDDLPYEEKEILKDKLMQFHPWRKGPYNIFGIFIDTEWRSDLKWDRLKEHISDLSNKTVLDVGCGNGYHCWRMLGAGVKFVLGIDPYLLSNFQFYAVNKFIQSESLSILPLKMEELPKNLENFDTVFSMGLLYHRKSPFDHLAELKQALKPEGELVLETLVIDGKLNEVLVPEGRYAKMRNVWFIPSTLTLESWLRRAGFRNIRLIDVTKTTKEEQRRTEWMKWESLEDFLDSNDSEKTIEGYPAPRRAIFICNK